MKQYKQVDMEFDQYRLADKKNILYNTKYKFNCILKRKKVVLLLLQ